MDQRLRNKLRNIVTECRKLLEDATAQVLQGRFGIYAARKKDEVHVEDESRMGHLSDEDRACRKDLLDHLAHIQAASYMPREALDQLIREIAFTHLNRLCAYKMMETRGIIREAVSRGLKSQGFLFYLADHPNGERLHNSGQQDEAYRHFLDWLGRTLSEEIGILFNPNEPANHIYPPQRVLDEVLGLINSDELKDIWTEDETIGWVYQYFTPKELRDKARKESQAPRNSYELAFRNQFYTPRYVVEFLTDNTLGRVWYEMRKSETSLEGRCRFLVRRPIETFLKKGEEAPAEAKNTCDDISQEEVLSRPVYVPHRAKKDPREIKILDPACGSGHFLLYCFDLLQVIYEEAYDDPDLGEALRRDYPASDDLRRAIPALILKHNLHGIDIDLRATQIAALALWLHCQRAYQELGLKNGERPKITRSNIVCAEPMPGEADLLKEFTATLQPKVLGQLVEVVFEKMKLAGEAGSLLKIEEEIKDAVAEARKQWQEGPSPEQQLLFFPGMTDPRLKQQELRFDLKGITDERFWEQAEDRILDALKDYAERAENDHAIRRRLFAEDAARGFAFIDLCRKAYDTVLMNPPFGKSTPKADQYLRKAYPLGYIDLYTAFLDRACQIAPQGCTGAITSRTALTLSSFSSWRKFRLLGDTAVRVCADLGYGVLDGAMVETACFTLSRISHGAVMTFIDLDKIAQKEDELLMAIRNDTPRVFHVLPSDLLAIPNAAMAYFLEPSLRNDLRRLPAVSSIAEVLGGNATSDDERFIRCFWEVPARTMISGEHRRWRWISKGGEYSVFYTPIHLVLDWQDDGGYLGEYMYLSRPRNGYLWGPKSWSSAHMGLPGVVWSLRSQAGVSFRALPRDCVMSGKSAIVTTRNKDLDLALLAILNTERVAELSRCLSTFGSYEKGAIASLPVDLTEAHDFPQASRNAFRAARASYSYLEIDPHFSTTIKHTRHSLAHLIQCIKSDISEQSTVLFNVLSRLNEKYLGNSSGAPHGRARRILEIAESITSSEVISEFVGIIFGRWDVRIALDPSLAPKLPDPFDPLPICPPGMLVGSDGLPAEPGRIVSEEWLRARPNTNTLPPEASVKNPTVSNDGYPFRVSWDGILVDDPEHEDDIVRRVREVMEIIWKDRAEAIEEEARDFLGVRELRDYFRRPGTGGFWMDHIKRYSKSHRKAPIYWYLRSAKGKYGLWLYYQCLDKDILFKALLYYVEPKIRLEEDRLNTLRARKEAAGISGREAKQIEKEMDRQEQFVSELHDFKDKLRRAADLHLTPDLNDGVWVALNIAPLWELVPWREAKKYWDELMDGKYEWSSIGKQLREKALVK